MQGKPDLMSPLLLLLLLCVLLLQRPGDSRAAGLQLLPQLLRLRSLPARTDRSSQRQCRLSLATPSSGCSPLAHLKHQPSSHQSLAWGNQPHCSQAQGCLQPLTITRAWLLALSPGRLLAEPLLLLGHLRVEPAPLLLQRLLLLLQLLFTPAGQSSLRDVPGFGCSYASILHHPIPSTVKKGLV